MSDKLDIIAVSARVLPNPPLTLENNVPGFYDPSLPPGEPFNLEGIRSEKDFSFQHVACVNEYYTQLHLTAPLTFRVKSVLDAIPREIIKTGREGKRVIRVLDLKLEDFDLPLSTGTHEALLVRSDHVQDPDCMMPEIRVLYDYLISLKVRVIIEPLGASFDFPGYITVADDHRPHDAADTIAIMYIQLPYYKAKK